jgi:hypothetical protein
MPEKCSVVVSEHLQAVLLNRVLQRALSIEADFYVGEGQISLASLGRNILVHGGGLVLVVKDAKTVDLETAEQSAGMARMVLGYVASEEVFDAFAFMPQLEVVFFEAPCVLRRYLSGIHELELELGRYNSAPTLERLLARDGRTVESFYRELDGDDLDALIAGPQLSRLVAAAEQLFTRTALAHTR